MIANVKRVVSRPGYPIIGLTAENSKIYCEDNSTVENMALTMLGSRKGSNVWINCAETGKECLICDASCVTCVDTPNKCTSCDP